MTESTLNSALRYFEATEANLIKAEKLLSDILKTIPSGIVFGSDSCYEDNCRDFCNIYETLPKIDKWKPEISLMELDEIAQCRFDAQEIGEIESTIAIERQIEEPSRTLSEYRYKFNRKRRELIRDSLFGLIQKIDENLLSLNKIISSDTPINQDVNEPEFNQVNNYVDQINTLLGSNIPKPPRWSDLNRHLHFGLLGDLRDIIKLDWPIVKEHLRQSLYDEKEAIPVNIEDLGDLVRNKPSGPVATKLQWNHLSEEDFERLIFSLISTEKNYENPEWLMKTNAPDQGRDVSAFRVQNDGLSGTIRQRVIIQCKHWQSKSVGATEISTLIGQMKLWEPPRVDVHIIATSGRFTSDAIKIIESQNNSDSALRIEMWPESHLERLLASRPALIAEFSLR